MPNDLWSDELMDALTDRREHELQRTRHAVSLRLLPGQFDVLAAEAALRHLHRGGRPRGVVVFGDQLFDFIGHRGSSFAELSRNIRAARVRLRSGQQGAGYAHAPGLPRPSLDQLDDTLCRAGSGAVQEHLGEGVGNRYPKRETE
jgi:hypothetical protein